MMAAVGPLGSVELESRAMKRNSPTEGSAVVLTGGQLERSQTILKNKSNALGSHMDGGGVVLSHILLEKCVGRRRSGAEIETDAKVTQNVRIE